MHYLRAIVNISISVNEREIKNQEQDLRRAERDSSDRAHPHQPVSTAWPYCRLAFQRTDAKVRQMATFKWQTENGNWRQLLDNSSGSQ